MKNLSMVAASLLALGISGNAMANKAPNFDFVGVSYVQADLADEDLDGFAVKGEMSFANNWFAAINYMDTSEDTNGIDLDYSEAFANVGYQFYRTNMLTAYVSAGYAWAEAKASSSTVSISADEDGWNAQVGVRAALTEQFELDANVRHVDIEESDQYYSLTGRYFFTPNFSADINYSYMNSDQSNYSIGVNYHF
ncbi:porin family protein [Idiomarina xiamenensis]|uniref:Outer membrane protein, porin family n=1 Tax=Idiomarina xiamenensis 10-D-4 TaxID=740709 RepID=K2KLU8_9GAMM|nr:porin family protein [Idiomarina xiamenensis]EKE87537.1 Outer membrane protein, porin family [Idiomarina xiamenensis 10-D-4]